jgi:ATP-dependent Zn protease
MLWWITSLLLLFWYVSGLWPRSQSRVHLPYSAFLAQVQADNVSQIHISGDTIEGVFAKTIPWPSVEPSAKASAAPAGGLQSATRAPEKSENATVPVRYAEFTTNFPSSVGDPTLMQLLVAHHVTVDVSSSSAPWFLQC